MRKILEKEELSKQIAGAHVEGYVLIKSYTKQPTKNGGAYISGSLEAKGTVPFKAWSNSPVYVDLATKADGYFNTICFVKGKLDFYGGSLSIILDSLTKAEDNTDFQPSDFFEEKYDADALYNVLVSTLKKNVSEQAYKVFETIMSTDDLLEKFLVEYAARVHHDACKSGLLSHTTKVTKMATMVKMYPEIYKRVDPDVLFVGCALHDIGKVLEYNNGEISETGKRLPHPVLGVLMLQEAEEEIVNLKGSDFYIDLLSIISSHHGEYGEPPRTVAAFVVSQLDILDATLTRVNEKLTGVDKTVQVSENEFKLI